MNVRLFVFLLMAGIALLQNSDAQQTLSPGKESLRLFNKYVPVIEQKNDAIVDDPQVITGDINGDGKPDCIVFFVLTPKEGGNAITGEGAAVYINTGAGMKVAGAFPDVKFCYHIDRISNEIIYVKEYECAPPYSTTIRERKFIYKNKRFSEI